MSRIIQNTSIDTRKSKKRCKTSIQFGIIYNKKNTTLLQNSKNEAKNLAGLPLNKRVQGKAGFTNTMLPMGNNETFGKIPTAK